MKEGSQPSPEGGPPRRPWNEKILTGHPVIAAPGVTRAELGETQPELLEDPHWVHQERLLLEEATRRYSVPLIDILNEGMTDFLEKESKGQISQAEQRRYQLLQALRNDYLSDPKALAASKN